MAAISFLSQQIANMRSQQVPETVIEAAKDAYYERLAAVKMRSNEPDVAGDRKALDMMSPGDAALKLSLTKNGKQYPRCVELIQLIQRIGSKNANTNAGTFTKESLGDENSNITFPSYAAALSRVQSDIWHFAKGTLLPYPDKSGTFPKYSSQFEDIKAYAQSYNPSLLSRALQGKANVNVKLKNVEKQLRQSGEGAMGSSVDVIETAEKLLSMNAATLGPDEIKVINDRLGSLLDARYPDRVYEFIYLAVEFKSKYPRVLRWLKAGSETGVGFTDQDLNILKVEAERKALPPILEKDPRIQEYRSIIQEDN